MLYISSFLLIISFIFTGCFSLKEQEISSEHIANSKNINLSSATMRPYKVGGVTYKPIVAKAGDIYIGIASWYGPNFDGKLTSNGEVYDMDALTVASKILPMNTVVSITNLSNDKSVIARVNDRGPFVKNRIVDLSREVAMRLDVYKNGTAKVRVEVLGYYSEKEVITPLLYSNIYIQLGAYKELSKAIKTKNLYSKKYNNIEIKKIELDGGIYYKVLIGKFNSENEAREFLASKVKGQGAFLYVDK